MKQPSIFLFLSGLAFLISCGSPENGPKFSKGGFVEITESITVYSSRSNFSTLLASGRFFEYAKLSSLPQEDIPSISATDECSVRRGPSLVNNISIPGDSTALDAGDKLIIHNGELGNFEILKNVRGSFIIYGGEIGIEGSLANGSLTVDIPGAAFPALTNVAFVALPQIKILEPSAANNWEVTTNTTFNWEGQSNDLVILYAKQPSPFVDITCYAKNDGSFTFPEKTKAELGKTGFIKGTLSSFRVQGQRFEIKDDTFVSLETQRLYNLTPDILLAQ